MSDVSPPSQVTGCTSHKASAAPPDSFGSVLRIAAAAGTNCKRGVRLGRSPFASPQSVVLRFKTSNYRTEGNYGKRVPLPRATPSSESQIVKMRGSDLEMISYVLIGGFTNFRNMCQYVTSDFKPRTEFRRGRQVAPTEYNLSRPPRRMRLYWRGAQS